MTERHSLSNYLAVTAPEPVMVSPMPTESQRRRPADIQRTLARNVAVLFGVDVRANPTGLTWVSDFNRLTIGEIARGAPNPAREDAFAEIAETGTYLVGRAIVTGPHKSAPGTTSSEIRPVQRVHDRVVIDEIPRATIQRYGPETKAALVLSGAQTLFSSLEPIVEDVLNVLGTSEDGLPLADSMRVVLWAELVAEVYRCQPALFVAALQARGIQQAALTDWRPDTSRVPDRSSRTEFPSTRRPVTGDPLEFSLIGSGAAAHTPSDRPDSLGVLDRIMTQCVRPDPLSGGDEAETGKGSSHLLIRDLVNRWCTYLTQSADQGAAWVREDHVGRRRSVEVYRASLQPLATYAAEVLAQMPYITPLEAQRPSSPKWDRFDPNESTHRARLRPRIPSYVELARLQPRSQRAVLQAASALLRVIRWLVPRKESQDETLRDIRSLTLLADRLFGPDDPQTVSLRLLWKRLTLDAVLASGDVEEQKSLTDTVVHSLQKLSSGTAQVDPGQWLDLFVSTAVSLNASRISWQQQGQTALAADLQEQLLSFWESGLDLLGLPARIDPQVDDIETIRERAVSVAGVVHNYVGFLMRFADPALQRRGIDYALQVVLPVREVVAQTRQDDFALRLTLQVIVRGIAAHIGSGASDRQEALIWPLGQLVQRLYATVKVRALVAAEIDPVSKSDVHTMSALALGVLCLLENSPHTCPYTLQDAERLIEIADKAQRVSVGREPGPWTGRLNLDRARDHYDRLVGRSTS